MNRKRPQRPKQHELSVIGTLKIQSFTCQETYEQDSDEVDVGLPRVHVAIVHVAACQKTFLFTAECFFQLELKAKRIFLHI